MDRLSFSFVNYIRTDMNKIQDLQLISWYDSHATRQSLEKLIYLNYPGNAWNDDFS